MGYVFWEDDPERKREIKRVCENCQRTRSLLTPRITDLSDVMIVSPSGVGHVQNWDGFERTACGIQATGSEWWWRA